MVLDSQPGTSYINNFMRVSYKTITKLYFGEILVKFEYELMN
jgi:hypothetical protein